MQHMIFYSLPTGTFTISLEQLEFSGSNKNKKISSRWKLNLHAGFALKKFVFAFS